MDRDEARRALAFAQQWASEGLLPPASLEVLRQRHRDDALRAADPDAESFGSGVLYALGGILLGCAVFAFYVLLQENGFISYETGERVAPWLFLAWGVLCSAGAFAIDLLARKPRLGDAFHVAALVAVTASGFPDAERLYLGFVAMAFAAGVLWYRRERFLVSFLALTALNVALVSILFGRVERLVNEEAALTIWFWYAIAQLPFLLVASRKTSWPWPALGLATATILVAGTFLGYYFDSLEQVFPEFPGDAEIYVAILMGAALATGLALREKGMVLAAAFAIAIDAIVFAFDVGDLVGGLLALLAVAGLLIWQASALRRYLRED
ncbi:MAG TPA: hypothetical protein VM327_02020 [Candidatus Thermoplasmatota archaeon]|nr:hypothetical protein [Candidatus Thermoplasmatota archaeon]